MYNQFEDDAFNRVVTSPGECFAYEATPLYFPEDCTGIIPSDSPAYVPSRGGCGAIIPTGIRLTMTNLCTGDVIEICVDNKLPH